MLQTVRRQVQPSSASTTAAVLPAGAKQRRLEIAFVSLAATNLFVLSSVLMFYVLAYKSS